MIKRILVIVAMLASLSAVVYAQVPRNPTYVNPGKSNFTALGVQGLDVTGNAGYIEIVGTDGTVPIYWYLWVNSDGKLMIASYSTISAFASFPSGDWRLPIDGGGFNPGTVVGSQS